MPRLPFFLALPTLLICGIGEACAITAPLAPVGPVPVATPDAGGKALQVAFLVVDGVYNTELMAPYDVFQHTVFHAKPGMAPFTVSPDGKPITTFEGLVIDPKYSFADAPPIDVLVVPSAEGSMTKDLENRGLIDWVKKTAKSARIVMSLCDGAFVLAQAGLLDGLPVTTFPGDYQKFAAKFPTLDLRVNVNYVDAGKVITSQGGARSYTAAMHLVERLFGLPAAQGIGRGLLIPWPPGSESEPAGVVEPGALPAGQ
ncbi:MAG: DJ-1/PfpI family protein [Acidobacteriota bacterium]